MENETDTDNFKDRLNEAVELMLARKFMVSIPTIRRWMNGTTSPHPLMQERIFTAFTQL